MQCKIGTHYPLVLQQKNNHSNWNSKVEIHRETLTYRPRIKLNLDPHFNIKVGLNQHHLCISSTSRSKPHWIICWQWDPKMPTCQPFTCSGYEPSKTHSCMHYYHLHLHLVRNHARTTTHNLAFPNTVAEVEAPAVVRALPRLWFQNWFFLSCSWRWLKDHHQLFEIVL